MPKGFSFLRILQIQASKISRRAPHRPPCCRGIDARRAMLHQNAEHCGLARREIEKWGRLGCTRKGVLQRPNFLAQGLVPCLEQLGAVPPSRSYQVPCPHPRGGNTLPERRHARVFLVSQHLMPPGFDRPAPDHRQKVKGRALRAERSLEEQGGGDEDFMMLPPCRRR